MVEVAILLLISAIFSALGLAVWRALGGPAASRRARAARIAGLFLIALVVIFGAAWELSKSRTFQFMGGLVRRVETDEPVVALTFDDGPTPAYTAEVLKMLADGDARATFMLVGAAIAEHPEEARALVAAGHELGNHSYSHRRMIFKSYAFVRDEVERTDALIRAAGQAGPVVFRPPYGKRLLLLPYYLQASGRTTVLWDVEPESYAEVAGDAGKITQHVLERARPGSIILLHVMYPGGAAAREALPAIIQGLRELGYRFVTVSELLALR